MIKSLIIDNLKSISHLAVMFTPLTVFIGENSCGKSTVLQALDFLCSITSRDIDEYLKDREWSLDDIKSQFCSPGDCISFAAEFEIGETMLEWKISINAHNEQWEIREAVTDAETGKKYLSFGNGDADTPFEFSELNIKSSALKMIGAERESVREPSYDSVLIKLKGMLASSSSFELLSPDRMRSKGSRGKKSDIGMGGEHLAAYIHNMPSTRRSELSKTVSDFIGYPVKISTTTKGSPGWVEMFLEESWGERSVKIKKQYISDGLLRIIALSAILVNEEGQKAGQTISQDEDPRGFILLDEIEDGVNPGLSEKLINRFQRLSETVRRQIIITSHSPVMVNYVRPQEIQFMWRDSMGTVHVKPLFKSDDLKEMLEFLNPGEIWFNYSKEEIVHRLSGREEGQV